MTHVLTHAHTHSDTHTRTYAHTPHSTGVRLLPQVLSLRRNQIGPTAGPALAEVLRDPGCTLTTLYLGQNMLETKGALDIAAALAVRAVLGQRGAPHSCAFFSFVGHMQRPLCVLVGG